MSFSITVLSSPNRRQPTKSFMNNKGKLNKLPYPKIKHWNRGILTYDSIATLYTTISTQFDYQPAVLIRGSAVDGLPTKNILRNSENFDDQGCNWLMVDVDQFSLPTDIDPYSEAAIRYFIKHHLPDEFENVTSAASFSCSAGIIDPETNKLVKDGLNVHLFFELTATLNNHQVKHWLKGHPVDLMLYSCVQPHYIMDPIIGSGVTCVLTQRHILIKNKNNVVNVPDDVLSDKYPLTERCISSDGVDWKDPGDGLPSQKNIMACDFMRAFINDDINCETRYLHARAFATNAYRTSGDSKGFIRTGLDYGRQSGYIHTDQIMDTIDSTRPISCRYIVESGYKCPKYNELLECCTYATSITSPYSLALQLQRVGI